MDLTSQLKNPCALCRLTLEGEVLTRLIHEDDNLIVTDCIVCGVPMVVLKAHRPRFAAQERERVRRFLRELVSGKDVLQIAPNAPLNLIFGEHWTADDLRWVIDWEQRQIPDHAHCHLRPRPFHGTHRWEPLFAEA